jgi:hypothetical protein
MNHPYLAPGQDVIYVDGDGKNQKAKITKVVNEDSADLEYAAGKHSAVAPYSDKGEKNTFHFEQASPKAEQPNEAKK